MKKLSHRAKLLLWIVYEHTDKDWSTGELKRFFVPSAYPYSVPGLDYGTTVSGSGDAAILRSLERTGLIERPRTNLSQKYVYAITEEGLMMVESYREEFDRAEKDRQEALNQQKEN